MAAAPPVYGGHGYDNKLDDDRDRNDDDGYNGGETKSDNVNNDNDNNDDGEEAKDLDPTDNMKVLILSRPWLGAVNELIYAGNAYKAEIKLSATRRELRNRELSEGQGWYRLTPPAQGCDTLSPIWNLGYTASNFYSCSLPALVKVNPKKNNHDEWFIRIIPKGWYFYHGSATLYRLIIEQGRKDIVPGNPFLYLSTLSNANFASYAGLMEPTHAHCMRSLQAEKAAIDPHERSNKTFAFVTNRPLRLLVMSEPINLQLIKKYRKNVPYPYTRKFQEEFMSDRPYSETVQDYSFLHDLEKAYQNPDESSGRYSLRDVDRRVNGVVLPWLYKEWGIDGIIAPEIYHQFHPEMCLYKPLAGHKQDAMVRRAKENIFDIEHGRDYITKPQKRLQAVNAVLNSLQVTARAQGKLTCQHSSSARRPANKDKSIVYIYRVVGKATAAEAQKDAVQNKQKTSNRGKKANTRKSEEEKEEKGDSKRNNPRERAADDDVRQAYWVETAPLTKPSQITVRAMFATLEDGTVNIPSYLLAQYDVSKRTFGELPPRTIKPKEIQTVESCLDFCRTANILMNTDDPSNPAILLGNRFFTKLCLSSLSEKLWTRIEKILSIPANQTATTADRKQSFSSKQHSAQWQDEQITDLIYLAFVQELRRRERAAKNQEARDKLMEKQLQREQKACHSNDDDGTLSPEYVYVHHRPHKQDNKR